MYTFTMRVRRNQTPSAISRGLFIIPGGLLPGAVQGTFPGSFSAARRRRSPTPAISGPRAIDADVDPAHAPRGRDRLTPTSAGASGRRAARRTAAGRSSTVTVTVTGESPAANVVRIGITSEAAVEGTKNEACPPVHRERVPSAPRSHGRNPDSTPISHAGSRRYPSVPRSTTTPASHDTRFADIRSSGTAPCRRTT